MQKKEIRKILIIILIAIVYTVLLIAIMQNRNISIIAKYEDMSKAMPESTEIADLQKQIERLQKENEDLLGEISKANATDDKVLSGEKVWSNGNIEEGTMANNGELNWNPETSTTYNVQAGYYSGGTLDSSLAYNKGKADGVTNHTETKTLTSTQTGTVDLGVNHNFRYINTADVYNAGKTDGDVKHTLRMQVRPNANVWPCYFKVTIDGSTVLEDHTSWQKGEDYYYSWSV